MRNSDRTLLRDYAMKHRRLFIRQPLLERLRRWLRAKTVGAL